MKRRINLYIVFGFLILGIGCTSNTKNKEKVTAYQHWELSDSLITQGIYEELLLHPEIPSKDIDVESVQGIVTLQGVVDNLLIHDKAEAIASAIKGVRGVINYINVEVPDVPDNTIELNVSEALKSHPVTDKYELIATSNEGIVTLKGTVDSWQELQIAEEVAKQVEGVRAIENKLAFLYPEAPRPDSEIKVDIEAILHHDIRVDDALIEVAVEDSKVTLSGTVGSVTERSRAITDAWVAGVTEVNADNLSVEHWARDPQMRKAKYVDKTDDELRLAVEEVLINDYRVNNFAIDVEVDNGLVTLKGLVDNLMAKRAAAEDAENVVGVWEVRNQLEVKPIEFVNNQALADQIRKTMNIHPDLKKYTIRVNTNEGEAQLYGIVGSFYHKHKAEDLTAQIPGVIDVENNLEVKLEGPYLQSLKIPTDKQHELEAMATPKSDEEIKQSIEKQLFWSPFVNEDEIAVYVNDGHVVLSGTVDTQRELDIAEKNAMQGGALTLENNLIVDYWKQDGSL